MYLAEILVLLSTCYYIASGFSLHDHRKGLGYLLKDVDPAVFQESLSAITTKWMNQPLDHFDKAETRTWKMRYFERLDFWEQGGPIYLFINGEDAANFNFLQTGTTFELAKETKGALFLSEHRYYGESQPFNEKSTENLKYLSSRQALADNARLLKEIKQSPKFAKSKIVVVGGSYAGNLATWMRLMYPDLVDAAIASSAPVLAKADFFEYLETVGDDYKQYGTPGCFDKIKQTFQRYENLLQTDSGIRQLKMEINICESTDLKKIENKQLFFSFITLQLATVAQSGTSDSFQQICQQISSSSNVLNSKDAEGIWNLQGECYDFDFNNIIKSFVPDPWIYQTCTEFGYYQSTSSADRHPFTDNVPVDFYYKWCTGIYGPEFGEKKVNEGVRKTNEMYGGVRPKVTNVVFVNGDMDPWHRLGVLKDLSNDAPAIRIPFSSHCMDLASDGPNDPNELKEARQYIKKLVKKWIGAR